MEIIDDAEQSAPCQSKLWPKNVVRAKVGAMCRRSERIEELTLDRNVGSCVKDYLLDMT